MGGLYAALNISTSALEAEQGALQLTSNNVANVNTPSYSRELVNLEEQAGYTSSGMGAGVSFAAPTAVQDGVLEQRLNQETWQQGQYSAYLNQMNPVQSQFAPGTGAGLDTAISTFFNSLQQLSTNPSDVPTRTAVLGAAGGLATSFNQLGTALETQQTGADQQLQQDVTQINSYTAQIATLNASIATAENAGNGAASLIDQRTQLLRDLSKLTVVNVTDTGSGEETITTGNGSALVIGNQSFNLSAGVNANGLHDVFDSNGNDITSTLTSGDIGGLIQARDTTIPNLLSQLNTLAKGIADAVNTQNAAGFDLSGAAGGQFFTYTAGSEATSLAVAITDPTKIAASSDGTAGSNGNATLMAEIANGNVVAGETPATYYSGIVSNVGSDVQSTTTQQQAGQLVLQQLNNQRASESGVSLDEEAVNLQQYQRAYQAAAQVLSVINSLTGTTMNMASGA